ncbi:MAG TPA: SDR family oxidoreductase [Bacteroidota bacterium]|nr:SDR family oxidoreductase [Bacteroidota bacterium]
MKRNIFLTGSTGFVGVNLSLRILKNDPTDHLYLLIRSASRQEARHRFFETLSTVDASINTDDISPRLHFFAGDITLSRLGLCSSDYEALVDEVTHIIHAAASVEFQLSLNESRRINCGGTREVMNLALTAQQRGHLQQIAYVSTAYVSGSTPGAIAEDTLRADSDFSNSYEQSKHETERYIRYLMDELPITIFRPSVIVGDSKSGITTSFNVLYSPLKLIYKGVVPFLPGSASNPLDVVPIDFVSDAFYHLFFRRLESIGKTYHLTAAERQPTVGEIADSAVDYFNEVTNESVKKVRFLPPTLFYHGLSLLPRSRKVLQIIKTYEPYFCIRRMFDNTNTNTGLQGTGIMPPRFSDYYKIILNYFIESQYKIKLAYAA